MMTPAEHFNLPILKTVTATHSDGQTRTYDVIGEGRLRFAHESENLPYDAWVVNSWFSEGVPQLLLKSQVVDTQEERRD